MQAEGVSQSRLDRMKAVVGEFREMFDGGEWEGEMRKMIPEAACRDDASGKGVSLDPQCE